MNKEILLYKSIKIELPSLTNEAHMELSKGWSFSNVYFLRDLKDIFLLIKKYGYGSKSFILIKCREEEIQSEGNKDWTERSILEYINALKNFGLISTDGRILKSDIFESKLGQDLTLKDKEIFKNIFFSYFRFKEIISWMIDPYKKNRIEVMSQINEDFVCNNSKAIFPFINEGRFTNNFFFELQDNADIFYIDQSNSDLMRFWDVFLKWGTTLNLLDRFQLKWSDINILPKTKSLSCVYFKKEVPLSFSLIDFIRDNYKSDYIYIPHLILDIVLLYRFSLDGIKELIVSQSLENRDLISMQRTSEIFIKEKERILLPMHRNSYISHLLML